MRVGDLVINPYVNKEFKGKPNPMYKTMVTHIGNNYTKCLRCDGGISDFFTSDVKMWEIDGHVDIEKVILGGE